jgi:bifunctional non-homologous end joining protein LigD
MSNKQYPTIENTRKRRSAPPRVSATSERPVANWDDDELTLSLDGKLVPLSRLSKVWYPATGTTKKSVLSYYRRIADALLPHLRGRPLTMKRYPEGVRAPFFYEKRCPTHTPAWLATAPMGHIDFCEVDSLAALLWVVNLGSIELHPYLMSKEDAERPLAMVFDLDPGPGTGLLECARVAMDARAYLKRDGLRSFPKTSGSKGIQVYVPLNPADGRGATFEETKAYSRALAEALEKRDPKRVTSRMAKNLRAGKVFIDWSQNDRAKTTVAVYSMRATESPQVSTPVRWVEIERALALESTDVLRFDPKTVLARVAKYGDLFKPVLDLRQDLPR